MQECCGESFLPLAYHSLRELLTASQSTMRNTRRHRDQGFNRMTAEEGRREVPFCWQFHAPAPFPWFIKFQTYYRHAICEVTPIFGAAFDEWRSHRSIVLQHSIYSSLVGAASGPPGLRAPLSIALQGYGLVASLKMIRALPKGCIK